MGWSRIMKMERKLMVIGLAVLLTFINIWSALAVTRTITSTGDTVETFIRTSKGNYYAATEAGLEAAIWDGNGSNSVVYLPGGANITVSTTINILLDHNYGLVIEGNGCNLSKGGIQPIFNITRIDPVISTIQKSPIRISDIHFYGNRQTGLMINVEKRRWVTIENCIFRRSGIAAGGDAYINFGSCTVFAHVLNCQFYDGYAGIRTTDNYDLEYTMNDGKIENCAFIRLAHYAVANWQGNGLEITGCTMENLGNATTREPAIIANDTTFIKGLYTESVKQAIVNFTENCTHGSIVDSVHLSIGAVGKYMITIYGDDILIRGNSIHSPESLYTIALFGSNNVSILDNTINTIYTVGANNFITSYRYPVNNLIISNNIVPMTKYSTLQLNDVSNVSIIGNHFDEMASNSGKGINISYNTTGNNNITIIDNILSLDDDGTDCIQLSHTSHVLITGNILYTQAAADDGIYLINSNNISITNNDFSGVDDEKVERGANVINYWVWRNLGYNMTTWGDILGITPRTTIPLNPVEGWIYVNGTSHHIFCYLNGVWVQLD
jgi:hypothetical protein